MLSRLGVRLQVGDELGDVASHEGTVRDNLGDVRSVGSDTSFIGVHTKSGETYAMVAGSASGTVTSLAWTAPCTLSFAASRRARATV